MHAVGNSSLGDRDLTGVFPGAQAIFSCLVHSKALAEEPLLRVRMSERHDADAVVTSVSWETWESRVIVVHRCTCQIRYHGGDVSTIL